MWIEIVPPALWGVESYDRIEWGEIGYAWLVSEANGGLTVFPRSMLDGLFYEHKLDLSDPESYLLIMKMMEI